MELNPDLKHKDESGWNIRWVGKQFYFPWIGAYLKNQISSGNYRIAILRNLFYLFLHLHSYDNWRYFIILFSQILMSIIMLALNVLGQIEQNIPSVKLSNGPTGNQANLRYKKDVSLVAKAFKT